MSNERRVFLVDKLIDVGLDEGEQAELEELQKQPWESPWERGLTQEDREYLESIKHITARLKSDDEARDTLAGCPDPDFYEDEPSWEPKVEPPIDVKNEIRMGSMMEQLFEDAKNVIARASMADNAWTLHGYAATPEDIEKLRRGADPRTIGPEGCAKRSDP